MNHALLATIVFISFTNGWCVGGRSHILATNTPAQDRHVTTSLEGGAGSQIESIEQKNHTESTTEGTHDGQIARSFSCSSATIENSYNHEESNNRTANASLMEELTKIMAIQDNTAEETVAKVDQMSELGLKCLIGMEAIRSRFSMSIEDWRILKPLMKEKNAFLIDLFNQITKVLLKRLELITASDAKLAFIRIFELAPNVDVSSDYSKHERIGSRIMNWRSKGYAYYNGNGRILIMDDLSLRMHTGDSAYDRYAAKAVHHIPGDPNTPKELKTSVQADGTEKASNTKNKPSNQTKSEPGYKKPPTEYKSMPKA